MQAQSLFTSESVSEGHPDKVADQVSDAVVDAMLAQDSESRIACETMIKTGIVILAGEIRSEALSMLTNLPVPLSSKSVMTD